MNPKTLKAMRISTNGEISYFDFYMDRKNNLFDEPYTGFGLTAGDYIGLKLAVYHRKKPLQEVPNKYGSKIVAYLKDPYYIVESILFDDIVLIDDAGDMDQTKLDKINSIIELKDNKVLPAELKDILIIDQTKLTSFTQKSYLKLAQADKEGKKHYGERKGVFPYWL